MFHRCGKCNEAGGEFLPKKLECLKCGSNDLFHYQEKYLTEYRELNKDNSISKRKEDDNMSYDAPEGIMCRNCYTRFDYELDSKGRVIELEEK
jgi:uncharacterized OB-fold protein